MWLVNGSGFFFSKIKALAGSLFGRDLLPGLWWQLSVSSHMEGTGSSLSQGSNRDMWAVTLLVPLNWGWNPPPPPHRGSLCSPGCTTMRGSGAGLLVYVFGELHKQSVDWDLLFYSAQMFTVPPPPPPGGGISLCNSDWPGATYVTRLVLNSQRDTCLYVTCWNLLIFLTLSSPGFIC